MYIKDPDGTLRWVSDPENLTGGGLVQDFAVGNPAQDQLDEQKRQQQYEEEKRKASAGFIQDAASEISATPGLASDIRSGNQPQLLKNVYAGMAAREANVPKPVAPPPISPVVYVTNKGGMKQGVTPEEAEAMAPTEKPLTQDQIQANWELALNRVTARREAKIAEVNKLRESRVANSGIMSGDMAKMYIASINRTATPDMLNAVKNVYDTATGISDKPISYTDLKLALAPQPKHHITSFSMEGKSSDSRLRTAVANDMDNGTAKVNAWLSDPTTPKTIEGWNEIINSSFSNLTRETARVELAGMRPKEMLIGINVDKANEPVFANYLVQTQGLTPEEARARAVVDKMQKDPDYQKMKQDKPDGMFYHDGNGEVKEYKTSEREWKLKYEKLEQDKARDAYVSGAELDQADPNVVAMKKAAGGDDVVRLGIGISNLDPNERWVGDTSKAIAYDTTPDAIKKITNNAYNNFAESEDEDLGNSIDFAINDAIETGIVRGMEDKNAYASLANEVYAGMKDVYAKKDSDLREKVKGQIASEMDSLVKTLIFQTKDGDNQANPNTFGSLNDANALGTVKLYKVDGSNIDEKAKQIVMNMAGFAPGTVKANALQRNLETVGMAGQTDPVASAVGIAFNKVKQHLLSGIAQEDTIAAKISLERDRIEADNANKGLITEWTADDKGNEVPITFNNRQEAEAWKRMPDLDKKAFREQKILTAKDYNAKLVASRNVLSRMEKYGEIKVPVVSSVRPDPFGNSDGIPVFTEEYITPTTENEFDAGQDYIDQFFGDHPDIKERLMVPFNKLKDKWVKKSAEQFKLPQPGAFKKFFGAKQYTPQDVINLITEVSNIETPDAATNDRIMEIDKELPGFADLIYDKGAKFKTGKPVLKKNTAWADEASTVKTPATEKDNEAIKWAKANPNDPRSKKILELNNQ